MKFSYCRYILLSLLETTKQFVLEEGDLHNLRIPDHSGEFYNKDDIQYFPDYKHNIEDYPNVQEYAPFHREVRDMQEYDDYRDEKEAPNLSKGGLNLFSWWKNEAESKRIKSGTYPPIANEITITGGSTTVDANATVDATSNVSSNATVDANSNVSSNATVDITTVSSNATTDATSTVSSNATVDTTSTVSSNATADAASTVSSNATVDATSTVSSNATVTANTIAQPAAISSDTESSLATSTASNGLTFQTTCVCYNVTDECIPFVVATGVTCIGGQDGNITTASASNIGADAATATSSIGGTTVSGIATASSASTTVMLAMNGSTPSNTTALAAMSGSTPDLDTTASLVNSGTTGQNTSADLNTKSTVPAGTGSNTETTSSVAGSASVAIASTGISMPTVLNMFGAGMFLPVYEIPVTPLVVVNRPSPVPTKKKKPFHKIEYDRDSQPTMLKLNGISNYTYDQMLLSENYVNKNISTLNGIPYTVLSNKGNKSTLLTNQIKKADSITVVNRIASSSNIQPSGEIGFGNNHLLSNKTISQNPEYEVLKIEPDQTFLKPLEKYSDNHPIVFDQKLASTGNKRDELIHNQRTEGLLYEPCITSQNTLNEYNSSNPQSSMPDKSLKVLPNILPENYTVIKSNIQTSDNRFVPDVNSFYNGFVKYNDTYLSENSNKSINLMDVCKNVSCQGNNYLSQCCSRVCGAEKCKGDDVSYQQPAPGYFNTTINKTSPDLNQLLTTNATSTQIPPNAKSMHGFVNIIKYDNSINSTPKCPCGSKPKNSRVVRENDMNDFVKFQLMHGMTAPDSKEMMNALKEASLEFQKVNREFRSNDPGIIFKMKGNGQNIHLPIIDNHILSKKEPEGVLPLNSNTILDDLRATISNSLLQSNLKPGFFPKDRYRFIRNQGLKDQMETIRENNAILEKIKKETEMELQRLCLLETKRREEELLFDRKRESELKELKTIQDLIHREFESRGQGDSAKRAISHTEHKLMKQDEPSKKGNVYSKPAKSGGNDEIDNLMYSSFGRNTSSSFKPGSNLVDIEKFPELEINNSANVPHDDALLLLNIGPDKESLSEEYRERREGYNNAKNKILKENIKSVHSNENNIGMLR